MSRSSHSNGDYRNGHRERGRFSGFLSTIAVLAAAGTAGVALWKMVQEAAGTDGEDESSRDRNQASASDGSSTGTGTDGEAGGVHQPGL